MGVLLTIKFNRSIMFKITCIDGRLFGLPSKHDVKSSFKIGGQFLIGNGLSFPFKNLILKI